MREPFICYDDGVCSRATNPMDPFASADCLTASCRIVCRSAVLQGAETGYDGDRLRRRARGPHSIRGQRPRICACAAPFPPPPRIDCDFGLSLACAIASDGEAFAFRAWQQARVSMLGGCRVVEGCCGVAADAQKACWGVAVDARGSKRDALACARRAARGCCVASFHFHFFHAPHIFSYAHTSMSHCYDAKARAANTHIHNQCVGCGDDAITA